MVCVFRLGRLEQTVGIWLVFASLPDVEWWLQRSCVRFEGKTLDLRTPSVMVTRLLAVLTILYLCAAWIIEERAVRARASAVAMAAIVVAGSPPPPRGSS
jgi:hypothetical protein